MTQAFEYTIKKNKRSKSLKIKIEQNGAVSVITPPYIPQVFINQFIKKNTDWVLQNLAKLPKTETLENATTVSIFGKRYNKRLKFSMDKKIGMYIQGENLIFNPTTQPIITTRADTKKWNTQYQKKLEFFLKNTASHYIIARTEILAKKMNTSYNRVTLKKQKTRWGSCSSQKNLNFNWQLVHFEPEIIDYVIIHELSHITHMNHSRQFWNLVETYDPEYRKHVGWLKRNGLNLS